MSANDFDVIVIGSGVSGGWAAKEFTERGLKTLLIDRGRKVEHGADYVTEGKAPFELPYAGRWPPGLKERDYFIQALAGPASYHFYNNDRLNPYVFDEEKPFYWLRADMQGGKSVVWGRQSYRWSEIDFEANKADGHGIDWPIRYTDVAPWYSYVERFIGVSGEALGLPQLPDSEFQPPMELNIAERHFKDAVAREFGGRVVTIGRTANLTQALPDQGRAACQYRSQCDRGCSFGSYFSSQSSTLPAARATGNLTELTDTVIEGLDYDARTRRVTGVRTIDANSRQRTTLRARTVVLCASCIATTQILLNSRSEAMPNGLGNDHDILGRYLVDHTWGAGATGVLPGYTDYVEYGRRPTAMYIPRFRNLNGRDADADFLRGYNYQSWGGGRGRATDTSGFGADLKRRLRVPGPWTLPLYGFGECLPYKDNRVTLSKTAVDRFGIPQVRIDMIWRENELKMARDFVDQAEMMLRAAGCTEVVTRPEPLAPGRAIHELGTARMGDDPTQSVVNKWNQLHVAPNLIVADGAAFSSGSCVNPSLTLMAMAARAADHAVQLMEENVI